MTALVNAIEGQMPARVVTEQYEIMMDARFGNETIQTAADAYETFRNAHDGPIKIGLYGEDLQKSIRDVGSILLRHCVPDAVPMPVLVATNTLEWYNLPYLRERYGDDTQLFTYVHPPLPDEAARDTVIKALKGVLDTGAVVLVDEYREVAGRQTEWTSVVTSDDSSATIAEIGQYEVELMNNNNRQKLTDVYVGFIEFDGNEKPVEASSLFEAYQSAIEHGDITVDPQNGPTFEQSLSENDVERVWQFYKAPFERLSKGNPMLAGYDEETLKALLRDGSVIKVVNRDNGEIASVGLLVEDFEHCPWFNKEYYLRNYREYVETGNVLLCPGIVSDSEKRGHVYSWAMIDMLTRVLKHRGPDVLLSFECTEISTRYIPTKVVERGIKASGLATTRGYEMPASTIDYKALKKTGVVSQ